LVDPNPYLSPSPDENASPQPAAGLVKDSRISRWIQIPIALITLLAHSYFWAVLISWTSNFLIGDLVLTRLPDFLLYACLVVCVISSGVALGAVINRRMLRCVMAGIACGLSLVAFMTMLWMKI